MNTTTRIGKIARLPHNLREQLNLQLHDALPAKSILPWLNSLPEVKAVLAADFDNRPITKQNLSEWKQGGFRDWLLQYHAAHFLQFIPSDLSPASSPPSSSPSEPQNDPPDLTEHATPNTDHALRNTSHNSDHSALCTPNSALLHKLLLWTQLQYTAMARYIDAEPDPQRKWNSLRQFSNDISRLRRSTVADDYLQIQRDWLVLGQSNTADKKEKEFWKWTKRPDIEKKLFPDKRNGLTPEALYEMETKFCLMGDGPGPEVAELMAEVRIAKRLLELRKAQEAEAKAKSDPNYDPNRPLPDTTVRLAGMPFEELFPTIPEKPLTDTHPELDDDPETQAQPGLPTTLKHETARDPADLPSDSPALRSAPDVGGSDPVQPSPTESNQIQPPSPLDSEPNPEPEPPNY